MMKDDEGWWRMLKDDEGWMKNDEGWWFQAVEGFCRQTDWLTDEWTDIGECRVAFATENLFIMKQVQNIFEGQVYINHWHYIE